MTADRAVFGRRRPIQRSRLPIVTAAVAVVAALAPGLPGTASVTGAAPVALTSSSAATHAPGSPRVVSARTDRGTGGFVTLAPTGRAGSAGQGPLPTSPEPIVESPVTYPRAGVDEASQRLSPPVTPAVWSTRYAYQNADPTSGEPVTWSPCRPVHFVINAAGAPAGFTALVLRIADEVAAGSGLRLAYDGLSSERLTSQRSDYQPERYGARWAPVLIGTMTAAAAGVSESTAGLTSLVRVSSQAQPDPHYVTGQIALFDAAFSGVLTDGSPLIEQVLRHEFGHLLGLGHTPALGQVMDTPNTGVSRLQAGDLTGLSRLGQGSCAPGI
ncbi:MAG: hypothetical protein PHU75_04445 [Candidatus Nanopelagicales bacterium]|nr:hypothetical protein [Candidatus Nanopelagicales bacterium]